MYNTKIRKTKNNYWVNVNALFTSMSDLICYKTLKISRKFQFLGNLYYDLVWEEIEVNMTWVWESFSPMLPIMKSIDLLAHHNDFHEYSHFSSLNNFFLNVHIDSNEEKD